MDLFEKQESEITWIVTPKRAVMAMLEQAPVQVAERHYVKGFVVLSPSSRINLAKACANYYAATLDAQVPSNREEELAAIKRDADDFVESVMGSPDDETSK